jgi:hypothetical protein
VNCPTCKNRILDNSATCEWCGAVITINIPINSSSIKNSPSKKSNSIYILLPGIITISIWVIGNLISEKDKHDFFGMDDLRPILILGLILLAIGYIIKIVKK